MPKIITMGLAGVAQFVPGPTDACISIRSPGSDPAPVSPYFRAVLRLYFDDTAGLPAGQTTSRFGGVEIVWLSAADADRIIRFAAMNQDAERIVVQCEAGISRSVAVGKALSFCFGGYATAEDGVINRHVFDAVCDAYKRQYGEGTEGDNFYPAVNGDWP